MASALLAACWSTAASNGEIEAGDAATSACALESRVNQSLLDPAADEKSQLDARCAVRSRRPGTAGVAATAAAWFYGDLDRRRW
jgi:hypothetical protein